MRELRAHYLRSARNARNLSDMPDTDTLQADKYVKVAEVAAYLNISKRAVYDLVAARELESARFGQGRLGLRVLRASVLKFEADRSQPATS